MHRWNRGCERSDCWWLWSSQGVGELLTVCYVTCIAVACAIVVLCCLQFRK